METILTVYIHTHTPEYSAAKKEILTTWMGLEDIKLIDASQTKNVK